MASALLILAVVPILRGLTAAHLSSSIIERRTKCLVLAQSELDEITARSIYNYGQSFTRNNTSVDGSYLCNVTDSAAGANLRSIAVSVGYDLDGNSRLEGDEINVTLSTYIAKREAEGIRHKAEEF